MGEGTEMSKGVVSFSDVPQSCEQSFRLSSVCCGVGSSLQCD